MRVLLPVQVDQVFTREQAESLGAHCEVKTSFSTFWENQGHFDIVQLNWPEELTQWREPTDIELVLLRRVLKQWREAARIVVTRHNFHPHYADTERYRELYEIVYAAAHAVVHMGEFSVREYRERYAGRKFIDSQIQAVIPHPVFSSYPETVDQQGAKRGLGINSETYVLLAFGRIQSAFEKNIVIDAFLQLPFKDKIVIVPGWKSAQGKEPVNRIKWLRVRASKRFRREDRFVSAAEVSALFSAADLALIPRNNVLNSGLISLCIKFDCPMISPKCGNLTEIAEKMGVPTFNPDDESSLRNLLLDGSLKRGVPANYQALRTEFSQASTVQKYENLYRKLL